VSRACCRTLIALIVVLIVDTVWVRYRLGARGRGLNGYEAAGLIFKGAVALVIVMVGLALLTASSTTLLMPKRTQSAIPTTSITT